MNKNVTPERKEAVKLQMTDEDRIALGTDYPAGEVSRAEAERYPIVHRGSVRFIRNLYRTESEHRQFIDDGLRIRLPGQAGHLKGVVCAIFARLNPRRG
jgi:hypothetical protein